MEEQTESEQDIDLDKLTITTAQAAHITKEAEEEALSPQE